MADGRASNGGARPGAGRKPKAEVFESVITKADKRIAKNLIRYIENMERLADGVLVQGVNPLTAKTYVYQEPPNRQANEYLINRIMGKPTERHEHTVTAEQILRMTDDEFDAFVKEQGIQ